MFIQETKRPFQQTDKNSVTTETDRGEGESFFCQRTTASICLSVCPPTCPATSHAAVSHLSRALISSLSTPSKTLLPSGPFCSLSAPCGGEAWILNMLHQSRVGGVGVTTLSSLQHDASVTESGVKVRSGGVLRAAWRHFEVLGKLMTAEFYDHNPTILNIITHKWET